jgi:polyhydroxyalkanoate synthesis regulator phasin
MKLTKKVLRELIKEELQHSRVLSESTAGVAAQMKKSLLQLQALIKSGAVTPEEAEKLKADLLQKAYSSPGETVASGATRMAPGQQGDAAANKKLAVVAKELQVLLAKIQQEL